MEVVFDEGLGSVFNARVAGNIVNDDILGSLEYATQVIGAKLVVVLGHSSCGAIKGACDSVKLGHLTGLLDKIQPAVSRVPASLKPRNSKNWAFVEAVAEENVRLAVQEIMARSPIIAALVHAGKLKVVGAMYDLSTGEVHFQNLANPTSGS